MKQVIIGIHGLGNKPPKYILKRWWLSAIREGFEKENDPKKLPEFELVYWADIIYNKPLNPWEHDIESPYFLDEPYIKASNNIDPDDYSIREQITDFFTNQLDKIFLNPDKSLNYESITDTIMQKYFVELEAYYTNTTITINNRTYKARESIRKQLAQVLNKYKNYQILLIAHSMGSIIAYDVLSFLTPHIPIDTLITIGSPLGLPVVVSKIISEQKKYIPNNINMLTPQNIKSQWINLADISDKVAIKNKLATDFNRNIHGIHPVDFLVRNDYEINGISNPHKSFGYLRTSEFAVVLADFIASRKMNLIDKFFAFWQ